MTIRSVRTVAPALILFASFAVTPVLFAQPVADSTISPAVSQPTGVTGTDPVPTGTVAPPPAIDALLRMLGLA